MKHLNIGIFIIFIIFMASVTRTQASQCVDCHTDAEKLKAIAKTLPQPEASAETAGKG